MSQRSNLLSNLLRNNLSVSRWNAIAPVRVTVGQRSKALSFVRSQRERSGAALIPPRPVPPRSEDWSAKAQAYRVQVIRSKRSHIITIFKQILHTVVECQIIHVTHRNIFRRLIDATSQRQVQVIGN